MSWRKKKEGFIITYTFFVGLLCLMISFYLLSIEYTIYKNNYSLLKYIMKSK